MVTTPDNEEEGRSGSAEPGTPEAAEPTKSGSAGPAGPESAETTTPASSTQPLSQSGGDRGDDQPLTKEQREIQRQQAELAQLRGQLDTREHRHHRVTVLRQIVAAILVFVAALGVTASVIGVWAGRTTLNTDRWVETVTPLSEDPAVRAAVAAYSTEQIFTALNVEQRIKEALPPKAVFLASPLTGQVHGFVQGSVTKALASPQFAELWPAVNRVAHKQIMAILNDDSKVVQSSGQTVTLNLLPVVNNVLSSLQQQVPTLFGKTVTLPTITDGQIPAGLQTKVESALGVKLPANFAAIPIYQGNQLTVAQRAVVQIKRDLTLLVVGTVVALLLALWISPRRRRSTLQFGLWLVIDVVALTSVIRAVRTQLIDQVPAGVDRAGVDAAVQIVFATLRERGTQLLWLGILIAVVAYLIGPGRLAVALRGWAVQAWQFLSRHARRYGKVAVAEGPGFAHAHLDPLRIGGLVGAGVLLLFFTSWAGLFWIVVLLAVYELLVTAVANTGGESSEGRAMSSRGPDLAR